MVETSAECSLIYGKSEQFPGPSAGTNGYGNQTVEVKAVSLPLDGWQAASVPEVGHRGGRGPPGSEKTRFNQMEASAGGEPTLGNAFCRRGIKGEDESGEPELHLSGLKSWLN